MPHIGGETFSAEGSARAGKKTPGEILCQGLMHYGYTQWNEIPDDWKVHWERVALDILADPLAEIVDLKAKLKLMHAEKQVAMMMQIPKPSNETIASLAACASKENVVNSTLMWVATFANFVPASKVLKDGEVAVNAEKWNVAQILANAWSEFPLTREERDQLMHEWHNLRSKEGAA